MVRVAEEEVGGLEKKFNFGQDGFTGGRDRIPDIIFLNRQIESLKLV